MMDAEREFEKTLSDALEEVFEVFEIMSFENAGLMTGNAGLVIRMDDGSEFQVTIVQSVFADEDED
jgi:hypothetical protein